MLSSISLRHMRVFVAVADHGTFTAAAEVLGLTPSGLTATIRQFEDVAGTPLFDRTTRQVTLSATGARFLPTARRLISEFEEALGDLDALSKGIGGTIRIAAAPSVLTRILPGVISRFVEEHPDARLRLDELNAGEVHEAVARNEADFGIAGEWHALPDIAFSPLFSDRFGVLCRPTHAFARRSAIAWSELADQAFVGLGPESGTRAMMAAQGSFAGEAGAAGAAAYAGVDQAEVAASPAVKRAAALGLPEAQKVLRRANASERAIEWVAKGRPCEACRERQKRKPCGGRIGQHHDRPDRAIAARLSKHPTRSRWPRWWPKGWGSPSCRNWPPVSPTLPHPESWPSCRSASPSANARLASSPAKAEACPRLRGSSLRW